MINNVKNNLGNRTLTVVSVAPVWTRFPGTDCCNPNVVRYEDIPKKSKNKDQSYLFGWFGLRLTCSLNILYHSGNCEQTIKEIHNLLTHKLSEKKKRREITANGIDKFPELPFLINNSIC